MPERFFRVKPSGFPFRESQLRVQLRQRRKVGSFIVDEMTVWVDDVPDPGARVQRVKHHILNRQDRDAAVRDLIGDSPT